MRKFVHEDDLIPSKYFCDDFYSYLSNLKKIDFQPPNDTLDAFVLACNDNNLKNYKILKI